MKPVAYLLILLLLSTQVADLTAFVRIPELQADQDDDSDDDIEYPPTQREQEHLKSYLRNKAALVDLNPSLECLLSLRSKKATAPGASSVSPFRPPVLHVFMSLQC